MSDPPGAVIPGASISATNVATGVKTARQTTGAGNYVLPPLAPGNYTAPVTAAGFQPVAQQNVIVDGSFLGSLPTTYLARTAFATLAPRTTGNVPRTEAFGMYAPRTMGLDVSLRREFKVTEKVKPALQPDAFNAANSVFFGAPAAKVDSANFGTLTTQANQPRKVQLSARISF